MTTNTTTPLVEYVEDGSTTTHAIPFKFLADSDLQVFRTVAGVVTQLALTTDYTATGAGDDAGGTLVKVDGGTSGATISIGRLTSRAQGFDYTPGDTFQAESHETALDRLSLVNQEQDVEIARAPKVARGATTPEIGTLTVGEIVYVDPDGNLATTENTTAAVAADVDTAVASAASAAADAATVEAERLLAEAAAVAAAASAATLTAQIPSYGTVALGLAGVADGEQFRVDQGVYDFIYTRQGSVARFDEARATTTAALAQEAIIAAEKAAFVDAGVPTDGKRILASTIPKTGGRMALNVNSNQVFTLNAVDALYSRDEEGNTTPTRTISTNVDPLGNYEAMNLNFTSTAHNLEQLNQTDADGLGTAAYTITGSHWQRHATDTSVLGLGSTSRTASNYSNAALTATWTQITSVFSASYDSTTGYDLGLVPGSGTTVPFDAEVYGVFLGIDSGGLVVPSNAELKAELDAGHARHAFGYPGALTVDSENWCTMGGTFNFSLLFPIGKADLDAYSLDALFEMTNSGAGSSFTQIAGFLNTPETSTTGLPYDGQIAMDAAGSRLLYTNPNLADLVADGPPPVLGNGPMHVAVTMERDGATTNAECITWCWGVPITVSTENMPDPFEPEHVIIGGQELNRSRASQSDRSMKTGDRWKTVGFVDRARADVEQANVVDGIRTMLGSDMPNLTSIMGSFDSLTAFSSAPFMQLADQAALLGGLITVLDAVGGSSYGATTGYNDPTRQALRRRQLQAMSRNHDLPIWMCNFGTNDLVSSVMDPTDSDGWLIGSRTIDASNAADVATVDSAYRSKLKLLLTTIPPRGDWAAGDADASDIARETARLAYNDDCRANYLSRGYDYLLDWEDGSYVGGFASLQAAAIDAYTNGDNTIFQGDGVHWSTVGGPGACAATVVPAIQAIKTEILV